jgi:hypothetical protein
MSITLTEAKDLVEKHLASYEFEENYKPILLENKIIEKDYGWFFQFTPKSWLETKLPMAPGSCSPILILKENGILIELGSAYSIDEQIYRFDKRYANQYSER